MIRLNLFRSDDRATWNQFVASAKNGTFLFLRDYLEYHADRFTDSSLMIYDDDDLVAVLPANREGDTLVSHGGLTFGGIISSERMRTPLMLEIFSTLQRELPAWGIRRVIYKAIPHIYHTVPAEEDLYALFFFNARLIRRDVSSTIDRRATLPFSKGRTWGYKQAVKNGLTYCESDDYDTFLHIEEEVLTTRHGVKPVHTASELQKLASHFPDNIKLFAVFHNTQMLGGAVMYANPNVAHAQYISANGEGKRMGALDLLLTWLINERYSAQRYFDFGISTESQGRYLNTGLINNKEAFGARATVYDFYEFSL